MRIAAALASALVFTLGTSAAFAEPVETEIPNVSAEVLVLRSSGGVTRLAVRYTNGGAATAETKRFWVGNVVLVDVKSKQKHLPIKDANGEFVGGPIGDSIDGGRFYMKLPPGKPGVLWTYFDALPVGTVVKTQKPVIFCFVVPSTPTNSDDGVLQIGLALPFINVRIGARCEHQSNVSAATLHHVCAT